MSKKICVLNPAEGDALVCGESIVCRNHWHITKSEAADMLTGMEKYPWKRLDEFRPRAKFALLPSGVISKHHIIQITEYNWRIVGQTKYKAGDINSRRFMEPGSPCYNLVRA